MRIKVGDTWYNGKDVPVMIELSESDKTNIANMLQSATKYCDYPNTGYTIEDIGEFMEVAID